MGLTENKQQFKFYLDRVQREGIGRLAEYLESSDFYTAPASTRFHGAYEGGLLAHSLNVYENLYKKQAYDEVWKEQLKDIPDESLIICGLLHDICKTHYYTIEMRNKKVDGRWEQVPFYAVDDKVPYGHGEK